MFQKKKTIHTCLMKIKHGTFPLSWKDTYKAGSEPIWTWPIIQTRAVSAANHGTVYITWELLAHIQ